MGIVGLVLLMATANIANLLLARGIARQREFAIRLATGAARLRLLRQLLTETLLLFGLGAIPGVIAARSGVGIIQNLFAEGRRAITLDVDLNWRVLAFTMMVTLAAALLAGLFPAWRAFRIDPEQAMREGSRAGDSRASAAITRTLVVFQVALSLVLLVGAVTFVKTLINLRKLDPGFPNDQVLTMSIQVPDEYRQEGKTGAIWARTLEAVRTIPGVRSAGLATFTPLSGRDRGWGVKIRGYQPATSEDGTIHINQVSEGYFETLGVRLLRGRLPSVRDTEGMPPVVFINETAARKYFGNRDPIGQTLDFGRRDAVNLIYEIAGIVQDTKHMNLREPTPAFAFVPLRQAKDAERRVTLAVSSSAPNGQMALIQPIRSKLAEIDPALFLSDIFTIRTQLDSTLLTERLLSGLSSAFGVLALLLAAVGLYGVLGYRIGQQRRSIAIRVALGASPASVGMGVIAQCSLLLAVGVMAGLPFALLAARAADSMSWGVTSSDPLLYAMGVALLGAAGLGSAWLPARRASAIDPAEALRHD